MESAFWVAAGAVLAKEATVPDQILDRWHECVLHSNDPEAVNKMIKAAFPDLEAMPMEELSEVALALLEKR